MFNTGICMLAIFMMTCKPAYTIVNKKGIQVDWLTGVWKHKDKEMYEKWTKTGEREYKGLAYDLNEGYANITENLRIYSKDGETWYLEAIIKENANKPILFTWVPDPLVELKFVNDKHDFPQVIQYHKESFDVMNTTISNMNGDRKIVMDYMRFLSQ